MANRTVSRRSRLASTFFLRVGSLYSLLWTWGDHEILARGMQQNRTHGNKWFRLGDARSRPWTGLAAPRRSESLDSI